MCLHLVIAFALQDLKAIEGMITSHQRNIPGTLRIIDTDINLGGDKSVKAASETFEGVEVVMTTAATTVNTLIDSHMVDSSSRNQGLAQTQIRDLSLLIIILLTEKARAPGAYVMIGRRTLITTGRRGMITSKGSEQKDTTSTNLATKRINLELVVASTKVALPIVEDILGNHDNPAEGHRTTGLQATRTRNPAGRIATAEVGTVPPWKSQHLLKRRAQLERIATTAPQKDHSLLSLPATFLGTRLVKSTHFYIVLHRSAEVFSSVVSICRAIEFCTPINSTLLISL